MIKIQLMSDILLEPPEKLESLQAWADFVCNFSDHYRHLIKKSPHCMAKINFHSQIFRYDQRLFCLPHWHKFSDFFDLCLHWVSVVRGLGLGVHSRKHTGSTHHFSQSFTSSKIHSHSQIFWYGGSIICLPHRPNFLSIFDLCLHWVSVVRGLHLQMGTAQKKKIIIKTAIKLKCFLYNESRRIQRGAPEGHDLVCKEIIFGSIKRFG